jgi:hypothetical protein
LNSCSETLTADVISSRLSGGVEMLTAITTSAHSLRALVDRQVVHDAAIDEQPTFDFDRRIAPGTDMLARIACEMLPRSSTTASPVTMSAAIARNGTGRLPKSFALPAPSAGEVRFDRDARKHALGERESVAAHADFGREQVL